MPTPAPAAVPPSDGASDAVPSAAYDALGSTYQTPPSTMVGYPEAAPTPSPAPQYAPAAPAGEMPAQPATPAPAGVSPAPQPTTPAPQQADSQGGKKKRHTALWVILIILVIVVGVFAAAAIGIIPRFWNAFLPQGPNEQAALDVWTASEEAGGVVVPNESLVGGNADALKSTLESAGFTDVTVETRYSFDVFGDDERNQKVDSTKIKGGADLEAGQKLKADTPIVITELVAPSGAGIWERVEKESNIHTRIADNPEWFEGDWRATEVESANSDLNNSKCLANTRSELMPTVSISEANATGVSVRATVNALIHYHDNDQPRDYGATDDKLEDVGQLGGTGSFIMGKGTWENRASLYQEFKDIVYKTTNEKGEQVEVRHPVSLHLVLGTDIAKGLSDDENAKLLDEIMGDDLSKDYADEEEALDAFQAALRESDHCWMLLIVDQHHDRASFLEGYRLERAAAGLSAAGQAGSSASSSSSSSHAEDASSSDSSSASSSHSSSSTN